MFMIS
ncbi:hypothetical protein VN97_g12124, partial [Penicillium thymicola]